MAYVLSCRDYRTQWHTIYRNRQSVTGSLPKWSSWLAQITKGQSWSTRDTYSTIRPWVISPWQWQCHTNCEKDTGKGRVVIRKKTLTSRQWVWGVHKGGTGLSLWFHELSWLCGLLSVYRAITKYKVCSGLCNLPSPVPVVLLLATYMYTSFNPLTPKLYSFQTTFNMCMPTMHHIFISVWALTSKLNPSALAAIMSRLVTLTTPTH